MNYQETLHYLYSRLPMFSRIGSAAYKKDLGNTIALCNYLGNPEKKFKSIHIAGTNGKGSVSHMLAAILQTAGYKTGLYTSPHLQDFRERIRVNGEMIGEAEVTRFTEHMKPMVEELEPSFFELTVAMAFDHFAAEQVDIAVIETGLGGRLDSTNVIEPEISVITNIGWDHMNILGNTLELIAAEKGGIIKQNVPVIIGESSIITDGVLETIAKERQAPMHYASQNRSIAGWKWNKHDLFVEVEEKHQTDHKKYQLDLPGIYQKKNLLTVLECCAVLHEMGWRTDEANIRKALKQVKKLTGLHARWEIIHSDPTVVLDVAHNEDGMNQLVQQMELTDHKELHIIIGMVKDKEISNVLSQLPHTAKYYFTQADIPRALDAQVLKEMAGKYRLKGETYRSVNHALRRALAIADPTDLVVVCGSVFLVGEVQMVMAPI